MYAFHLTQVKKLKYIHHSIDTYFEFQWASALNSEQAASVIIYLLETMSVMGILIQFKIDNVSAYVSSKIKQFFNLIT